MSVIRSTRRSILGGAALAAGVAGAGVVAACSGPQIEGGPGAAQNGQAGGGGNGKVTWLVRSTVAENNGQEKVFEPMIKQKLPGVELERVIVPSDNYIPKINAMAAAQESLELWGFGGNYFDYWWRGLPQDLTSYISADKWDVNSYFQPGLMDIYKINNKYYGLSQLTTYGSVLVYNKDLLDQAGLTPPPVSWDDASWTMDKALEYALKLTKNAGKPDAVYGLNMVIWAKMTSLPYLWGADAWVPEHYTQFIAQKTNFNSDPVLQAHAYLQDLIYKHQVMPDPATAKSLGQIGDPFLTGRIAMEMDGGWLYWNLSAVKDFKYGYAALPTVKSNKNINFDDFWIMGRWAKNKDAAWQVMRVLTSVDATTAYSQMSFTPPTPRESLSAWLNGVSKATGQSVADLTRVTTGSIEKKRSQESPDHLFIQHPKLDQTYSQELDALTNNQEKAATWVPRVGKIMDETVKGIYDQFKDSRPKD
jgi:multiple sugar transport system substrate-binding protein